MVLAIGSNESTELLRTFRDQLGLTYPVLIDEDGAVHVTYRELEGRDWVSYPEEWLIDSEGRIAYFNDTYEPDELAAAIEEVLERQ